MVPASQGYGRARRASTRTMESPASPMHSRPRDGAAIEIADLERTFEGGVRAIEPLTLELAAGSFVSLLGPSGCGKSTLMRLLAGLDTPTGGTIRRAPEMRLACVFQDPCLLPWRTVLDNAALPLELRGVGAKAREAAAREVLAQVGLSDALERYPAQLSGGMKMRVSLARALVTEPTFLLLDEPFAALDEITRQTLDDHLRDLWRARGFTVLFVTHAVDEAAYVSDRALVLSRKPGRLVLDHALALPTERTAKLRSQALFAAETGVLREALSASGGAL
jgi:NitT/TauT family transport system ATP-binding protein